MADTEVNKRCRAATSVNRDLAVVQDERVRIHVSADVGGAYVLQRDRRHSGLDRFELKNREGSGAGRRKVVAHLVNHLDVAVARFLGTGMSGGARLGLLACEALALAAVSIESWSLVSLLVAGARPCS